MEQGEVRKLWLPGPTGRLEAALRAAPAARAAAVIAHPHPLHGGTLDNPVVFHTDRELNRDGFTTLRFNFRGVGTSDGEHDDGRGEVEDVAAAVAWLRGAAPGLPLLIVGYSFGSLCGLRHAVTDRGVAGFVALGLPVRRQPVDELSRFGRPLAVVQADADEFGTPDEVRPLLEQAHPPGKLLVVEGTSHLFPDRAREAGLRAVEAARGILADLQ